VSTTELLEKEAGAMVRRLFAKDPTLWVDDPETPELVDRLGWLDAPQRFFQKVDELTAFADDVKAGGFDRVLLLGMGGSSLAPEVFARTFRRRPGSPALTVLDTTHPDAVQAALDGGEIEKTLFVVSSKSGTTIETSALTEICWKAAGENGAQFVAITDPDTALAKLAASRDFRRCFCNDPDIGGRFSALTYFGLVPAALTGVPVREVLERAADTARADSVFAKMGDAASVSGAELGAHMAASYREGRDKLTLATTPGFGAFGVWMEQLVAESTGKEGKGIIPIVDEPLAARGAATDRCYVTIVETGMAVDLAPWAEAAPRPALHRLDVGSEFYRWEIATALACAWLRVNPFDQPNVAEAKKNAEAALKAKGGGPAALASDAVEPPLRQWVASLKPGDYAAILAYVSPTAPVDGLLLRMRRALLGARNVATTASYGPRFLHSTGQIHKGGPPSGAFLQIETEPAKDIAVPGAGYTLSQLIAAQAMGDYQALVARGRRVVRVRLKANELEGLTGLLEDICRA
jgi:transaldolase / glucose-6-phosphate isomerase